MPIKLGMEAKIYYKVGGQSGGGAWTELTNVRDVTLSLETGEADVTTRANAGWRAVVSTLKEASVEFEMVWDTADAGFTAIKNAYLTNAPIGFQVRDGVGGQGLQADFMITQFRPGRVPRAAPATSVSARLATSPPARARPRGSRLISTSMDWAGPIATSPAATAISRRTRGAAFRAYVITT